MPDSACMGSRANSGLRIPSRHDTITPNSRTVMALLRKAAPKCPGTGMVGRISHLLSRMMHLWTHRTRIRNQGAIHSVGQIYSLLRIKQASYQYREEVENMTHPDATSG